MLVLWLIFRIYSTLVCHGRHIFATVRYFEIDPNGPLDKYMSTFGGKETHGRWVEHGRCRRCSLREDGKGFDY
jgi:hypothetical protein